MKMNREANKQVKAIIFELNCNAENVRKKFDAEIEQFSMIFQNRAYLLLD